MLNLFTQRTVMYVDLVYTTYYMQHCLCMLNLLTHTYGIQHCSCMLNLFTQRTVFNTVKGSGGPMDKVYASQTRDRGFKLHTRVTTMIPHMTPILVGSRKRTQELLNELLELTLQSS